MRTEQRFTINDTDLVEHIADDVFARADDPGMILVRGADGQRAVIQASSLDAAARLVAAAEALRDEIARSYRPANEIRPGWLVELPGLEQGARVTRVTPASDGDRLLLRFLTPIAVRQVDVDQLVRVIDEGLDPTVLGGCGHHECFDADGHSDGCVHEHLEVVR